MSELSYDELHYRNEGHSQRYNTVIQSNWEISSFYCLILILYSFLHFCFGVCVMVYQNFFGGFYFSFPPGNVFHFIFYLFCTVHDFFCCKEDWEAAIPQKQTHLVVPLKSTNPIPQCHAPQKLLKQLILARQISWFHTGRVFFFLYHTKTLPSLIPTSGCHTGPLLIWCIMSLCKTASHLFLMTSSCFVMLHHCQCECRFRHLSFS